MTSCFHVVFGDLRLLLLLANGKVPVRQIIQLSKQMLLSKISINGQRDISVERFILKWQRSSVDLA